jgi:hypothetical protein
MERPSIPNLMSARKKSVSKLVKRPGRSFTTSFTVEQSPQRVFDAILDVRGWWSGDIQGPTDQLGAEFTYRYKDFHRSTQRITELIPGKKVTWLVTDARLNFVKDRTEWNGTQVVFEITRRAGKTLVRFSHLGLVPSFECYGACSGAWSSYVKASLRQLIIAGRGEPNALSP